MADAQATAHGRGESKTHKPKRRRRLLIGTMGVLVLAAALWFGIPLIWLTLNTESTDDAYVNDHVTFVAGRPLTP